MRPALSAEWRAKSVCIPGSAPVSTREDPRERTTFWWQTSKNRLFVCNDPVRSHELRKLIGRGLKNLTRAAVDFRRRYEPFKEEINLCLT